MKPVLIIVVILASCSNNIAQDKKEIIQFNEFLGTEKALALDNLVVSFQEFLRQNYSSEKSLAAQTQQFLEDLLENDCEPLDSWKFNTKENLKVFNKFEKSGLRKEIYLYRYELDTYELSKSEFSIYDIIKETESEQTDNLNMGTLEVDFDSLLLDIEVPINETTEEDCSANAKREQERQNRRDSSLVFNNYGRFLYGLAKFGGADSSIYQYAEVKLLAGDISPLLITNGLLTNVSPQSFEDPFLQRIIVVELYYFLMRSDLRTHNLL